MDIAAVKVMNQDFVKFDHTKCIHWHDKMMFLLITLEISYVLDLQPFLEPSNEEIDNSKSKRKKQKEDELLCQDTF